MIVVSSLDLYPLSINFLFNCLLMLVRVSSLVLDRRYLWISPLGIAALVHSGWYDFLWIYNCLFVGFMCVLTSRSLRTGGLYRQSHPGR